MSKNGSEPKGNLYACCFCGEPEAEPLAVEVVFNWSALVEAAVGQTPAPTWTSGPMPEPIHQQWFSHPKCLVGALHPSVREFSDEVDEFLHRSGAYE